MSDAQHRKANTRLILFDMDGTLVMVSKCYREGVVQALQTVYGVEPAESEKGQHSGNSQRNILRFHLQRRGVRPEVAEAGLDEAMSIWNRVTIEGLDRDLSWAVLPGIPDLLCALEARGERMALVTGTLGPMARTVLERAGLARFFPVQACGDEVEDRLQLLQLGIKRAAIAYDMAMSDFAPIVAIGDGTRDIEAARAVGARVVSVATGFHDLDTLRALKPDAAFADFQDWQQALDAILA